jgi:hypothetical protein
LSWLAAVEKENFRPIGKLGQKEHAELETSELTGKPGRAANAPCREKTATLNLIFLLLKLSFQK